MDLSKITTYQAGIVQSQAYRNLKVLTTRLLKKHDLTMMQWYVLGCVYDGGKQGVRISDLAVTIDTTVAFITNHINVLESRGLVKREVDARDTRVRRVALQPKATTLVEKIEVQLRIDMRAAVYRYIQPQDLATYVKVLEQLTRIKEI